MEAAIWIISISIVWFLCGFKASKIAKKGWETKWTSFDEMMAKIMMVFGLFWLIIALVSYSKRDEEKTGFKSWFD